jgi:hypothetical protein
MMGDPDDVRPLSAALPNASSGFGLAFGGPTAADGANPPMPSVTAPPSLATAFGPRSVTAITPIANDSLKAFDPSSLASDPVLLDGGAPNDLTAARSDGAGGPGLLAGLNGATSTSGMDGATAQNILYNGPPELNPDGLLQIGNARIYPYVTSFIDANLADAIKLANMIGHGATADEVLALSGLEVLYGKYPLASVHGNYFGIYSDGTNPKDYFPGQIGTIPTTKDGPLATYDPKTGFYESGLRLVKKMKDNVGNADLSPTTFFKLAHSVGWGATTPKYMRDIQKRLWCDREKPQGRDKNIMNRALGFVAILLCSAILPCSVACGQADAGPRRLEIAEARQIVRAELLQDYPDAVRPPGFSIDHFKSDLRDFVTFHVAWNGASSGGSTVDYFDVNMRTADIWMSAFCQEIKGPLVQKTQALLRRRIHLSARGYKSLRTLGPFC